MMNWLNGKKTYLGMIGLGILSICYEAGLVDAEIARLLGIALSTWTGVAIRHAFKKGK